MAIRNVVAATVLLLASALPLALSSENAMASAKPPTDWTYYVASYDTSSKAQSLGCSQAGFDNSHSADSYVTMDFGAQRSDGAGTFLASTSIFWSNSADETYALWFAYGYQSCSPSHVLTLSIGTSNDGTVTDGALGADWGAAVASVASNASADGYSNVQIQGAVDAESGYGPFAHFQGWELGDSSGGGYVSRTKLLISNFGDAAGCPQALGNYVNQVCSGDWHLSSEYDASYGWAPNLANPEIYYNGCNGFANQPNQWANISDYGKHYGSLGQIIFEGPLDNAGNCLTASQAWSDFQTALSGDGVINAMLYSTEIVTK